MPEGFVVVAESDVEIGLAAFTICQTIEARRAFDAATRAAAEKLRRLLYDGHQLATIIAEKGKVGRG
jgi:hypothetical protein